MRMIKNPGAQGGLTPEEYQGRLNEAINKYGEVGLAFDPSTGYFSPGRNMLPTAEVEGKFVPHTKEEYDAYMNLGAQGGLDMRDMQGGITEDRNVFAENYIMPPVEFALNFSSVGKGAQILGKGYKLAKATAPLLKKQLAKQLAKKSGQLAVKKKAQAGL